MLANALGIATGSVSNKRNGARAFSLYEIKALADFFDVSTDYLLGRSEEAGEDD